MAAERVSRYMDSLMSRIGMRSPSSRLSRLCVIAFLLAVGFSAQIATLDADDWPQWRGEDRLAVWAETGIVEELPTELKVSWKTPVVGHFTSPEWVYPESRD